MKPLDTVKIKKNILLAVSAVFALSCIGAVIYYIFGPSAAYLHSDCTDSILWAKASVDSGKIFDPNFSYAAMLPIGGSLIMIPLIKIFGYTMLSQQLGMALFTLIFFASIFFLCKSAAMSASLSLASVGMIAMTLFSSAKLREIFYEHTIYYSISIMLLSVMLALAIKYFKIYNEHSGLKSIILINIAVTIVFILGALDGMQVIAMGILPVFAAVVADIIFTKENKIFSVSNFPKFLFIVTAGVSLALGVIFLAILSKDISAGYADAYSSYSNMNEWYNNIAKLFEQWFALFGVDAHYGMKIFSFESIINIIRLACAIITGVAPIAALFCFNKLDREARMIVSAHFAMTAVILFGYIFGILSAANWRLSPMICTGIIICALLFKLAAKNRIAHRIMVLVSCVLILMCGVSVLQLVNMRGLNIENNAKYDMVCTLEENDLHYGYATFWNSQAITLLSDSSCETININVTENGPGIYNYQTDLERIDNPDGFGRVFILLSDDEIDMLRLTEDKYSVIYGCSEAIECSGYTIFVFDHSIFGEILQ